MNHDKITPIADAASIPYEKWAEDWIAADNNIAQAVRLSHCSKEGDHECVGTCLITKDGIKLECRLCGIDDRTKKHRLIIDADGLVLDSK